MWVKILEQPKPKYFINIKQTIGKGDKWLKVSTLLALLSGTSSFTLWYSFKYQERTRTPDVTRFSTIYNIGHSTKGVREVFHKIKK